MEALKISDLANACQTAKEYSDLEIPNPKQISNLSVNDFVQLSHAGERFEVKIEQITGDEFVGTVRSDLVFNHPFKLGDFLVFASNNIFNLYGIATVETEMANNNYKKADKG